MVSAVVPRPVTVVSRRAWKKLHDSILSARKPTSSTAGKNNTKADDKPWPRSMQIAGYAAAGVSIPYFSLWLITSNPTLRDWLGPFLPMDRLRSHYGHLEGDGYSYVDLMEVERRKGQDAGQIVKSNSDDPGAADSSNGTINVGYYQFPEEMPYRHRLQEKIIESNRSATINATILAEEKDTLAAGTSSRTSRLPSVVMVEEKVKAPGAMVASQSGLKSLLKSSLPMGDNVSLAVEFDDSGLDDDTNGKDVQYELAQQAERRHTGDSTLSRDPSHDLLQATHTFSKWYSIPVSQQQQQQQHLVEQTSHQQKSSAREIRRNGYKMEISRLEHQVAELEKNLKDPTCTRDIDEMVAELTQSRRQLSAVRWKQRLGW